jgi:mRNA interferase MazF
MGGFVKGEVVITPFPFSDLSTSKKRPALVIAALTGDDVILCQITSKNVADSYAIPISSSDFTAGNLRKDSNVRPNRIFTADSNIFLNRAGVLAPDKVQEVIARIVEIINT